MSMLKKGLGAAVTIAFLALWWFVQRPREAQDDAIVQAHNALVAMRNAWSTEWTAAKTLNEQVKATEKAVTSVEAIQLGGVPDEYRAAWGDNVRAYKLCASAVDGLAKADEQERAKRDAALDAALEEMNKAHEKLEEVAENRSGIDIEKAKEPDWHFEPAEG